MHQGMRTRMPRSPPGARLCAPAAQPRRAAVDAAQSAREDSSDDILMKDRTIARRTRTRGRGPRRRRTGRRWTGRRRSRWRRWRRTGRRRTRWRGAVATTVATVTATDDSACRTGHRRAVKQLTGGSGPTYDRLRGRQRAGRRGRRADSTCRLPRLGRVGDVRCARPLLRRSVLTLKMRTTSPCL